MTHSYNVEMALTLGNVPDAVVLKEIFFWCKANEEKGINHYDGRYWTYGSAKDWQEKFPEFKTIGAILKRLEKQGWVIVGNYNKTSFDRTKWYTLSDKSISIFHEMDLKENENRIDELFETIPTINTTIETTTDKTTKENIKEKVEVVVEEEEEVKVEEEIKEEADEKPLNKLSIEAILRDKAEIVEKLYRLYPTKTLSGDRGERSTGKCAKDKNRIANLLRTYSPEQIENSIEKYVEEMGGMYLKNFSTFLNNLPIYDEDVGMEPTEEDRLRALGYQ